MLKFVLDEDMPRSTGEMLKEIGHQVYDVRDVGLRGSSDNVIFDFAQKNKAVLLTGDLGFGNILHFPLGAHYGIIISHFPNEVANHEMNSHLKRQIQALTINDLKGNLLIIEPGKIRIKRAGIPH